MFKTNCFPHCIRISLISFCHLTFWILKIISDFDIRISNLYKYSEGFWANEEFSNGKDYGKEKGNV
jgi:hypothetical protein